jgi:3'-phosphoadenosine 5'-phosphosulfate sulfotransferase (PAPS reductase)/FAD synthetase
MIPLPLFGISKRPVSTTPDIDALLAAGAPVAMGVSGGKDSCAQAIAMSEHLDGIGHTGPRILIHSHLGRVEWADSLPTCERLSEYLGIELVVARRKAGDMMDRWLTRWKNNVSRYIALECVKLILPWSTPAMRFCTSELKTAVICRELIRRFPGQRIVSVSGIRREESANRRKAPIAKEQPKLTSRTHQTSGIDLNAIIEWSIGDVFAFLRERDFRLHEGYTVYGSSRISCRYCIMGSQDDLKASAAVPEHLPLYREMVGLEIESGFSFQGGKWLGDVAPHLLTPKMTEGLALAKAKAKRREAVERAVPKHLLYTKGWPTCIPTASEAALLARVRNDVADCMGFSILYRDAPSIIGRYEELMAAKSKKKVRKAA